jgi:hypothetical protein
MNIDNDNLIFGQRHQFGPAAKLPTSAVQFCRRLTLFCNNTASSLFVGILLRKILKKNKVKNAKS